MKIYCEGCEANYEAARNARGRLIARNQQPPGWIGCGRSRKHPGRTAEWCAECDQHNRHAMTNPSPSPLVTPDHLCKCGHSQRHPNSEPSPLVTLSEKFHAFVEKYQFPPDAITPTDIGWLPLSQFAPLLKEFDALLALSPAQETLTAIRDFVERGGPLGEEGKQVIESSSVTIVTTENSQAGRQ